MHLSPFRLLVPPPSLRLFPCPLLFGKSLSVWLISFQRNPRMLFYAPTYDPEPGCVSSEPFYCAETWGLQELQLSTYPLVRPHVVLSREIGSCQGHQPLPLVVHVHVGSPGKLAALVPVEHPLAVASPCWVSRSLLRQGRAPVWQGPDVHVRAVPDAGNGPPSLGGYSEQVVAEYFLLAPVFLVFPMCCPLWWSLLTRSG